jgi:hypothetical protein
MSDDIYKDPNRFYVYAYLREDGTPYYIGKGSANRINDRRRHIKPPIDKSRIVILKNHLTEQEAFDQEIELIKFHGRKNNGTGILRNLTNGGEGLSGFKHSETTKNKMKGKKHSEESKRKMSISTSGLNNPNYVIKILTMVKNLLQKQLKKLKKV